MLRLVDLLVGAAVVVIELVGVFFFVVFDELKSLCSVVLLMVAFCLFVLFCRFIFVLYIYTFVINRIVVANKCI